MGKAAEHGARPPWPRRPQAIQSSPCSRPPTPRVEGPFQNTEVRSSERAGRGRTIAGEPHQQPHPTRPDLITPRRNKTARQQRHSRGLGVDSKTVSPASAGVCPTPGSASPWKQAADRSGQRRAGQEAGLCRGHPPRIGPSPRRPKPPAKGPAGQRRSQATLSGALRRPKCFIAAIAVTTSAKGREHQQPNVQLGHGAAVNHFLNPAGLRTAANPWSLAPASLVKSIGAHRDRGGDRRAYARAGAFKACAK